jgi:TonB family protein
MAGRIWPALLLLAMLTATAAASISVPQGPSASLEQREMHISGTLTRAAQFVGVPHLNAHSACQQLEPPQPLTTPNPLFTSSSQGRRVKVSFIIGSDGRVHSPLILESAGLAGDRHVLETVRTWRYRPATCNGIPTETEGKVEFSSR